MDALVHIVDDDDAVRDSLHSLLDSIGIRSQGHACGQDFVTCESVAGPGCVLLDLRIPDMSGLDVQRICAQRAAHLPVIFMTGHGDIQSSVSAMREGASDFLTKPLEAETLLASVRTAVAKSREALSEQGFCDDVQARMAELTPRETDIFHEVVAGWSNKHIARRLGISPKTVELHRANVMHKMRAGSLAELVRLHLTGTGESASDGRRRGPGAHV